VVVDVAARSAVEGDEGSAPVTRHRSPSSDICGDGVTREEPDVDARRLPLHRVDSPANVVEPVTVGLTVVGLDSAPVEAIVGIAVGPQEIGSPLAS